VSEIDCCERPKSLLTHLLALTPFTRSALQRLLPARYPPGASLLRSSRIHKGSLCSLRQLALPIRAHSRSVFTSSRTRLTTARSPPRSEPSIRSSSRSEAEPTSTLERYPGPLSIPSSPRFTRPRSARRTSIRRSSQPLSIRSSPPMLSTSKRSLQGSPLQMAPRSSRSSGGPMRSRLLPPPLPLVCSTLPRRS
jgi:hypothetical protein